MPLDKQADLKRIEAIVLVPDRRVGLDLFLTIVLNYDEIVIIHCTARHMQTISRTESGEQKQVACAVVCGTFQFPEKDTTPMVMVGLGTGIVAWLCLTSYGKCCHYFKKMRDLRFSCLLFYHNILSV